MDDIRIERSDNDDDLSKYSPEQLKIIMDAQDAEDKRKAGGRALLSLVGIILLGVLLVPIIARLYDWGFGG